LSIVYFSRKYLKFELKNCLQVNNAAIVGAHVDGEALAALGVVVTVTSSIFDIRVNSHLSPYKNKYKILIFFFSEFFF
jgi:hypothetical protein